ncbi:MAG: hypothetical protein QW051_02695 [Candidatus Aenigmatarchaeota archaeon]
MVSEPFTYDIFEVIPKFLLIAQILITLFFSWVFGSISLQTFRKKLPFYFRLPLLLATGFVCFLAANSLKNYIFFFQENVIKILQIDIFVTGILISFLFSIAFYLISKGIYEQDENINELKERIKLLESILIKEKIQPIKEIDIKKTAEALVPGFSSKEAKLNEAEWEVFLEKGNKKAKVIFGAYTGEVRKIEYENMRNTNLVIGALIILSIFTFTILNFKGFPNIYQSISPLFGLTDEQFNSLFGIKEMPKDCVATIRILSKQGVKILGSTGVESVNEEIKTIIKNSTNNTAILAYEAEYNGKNYTVVITLPKSFENKTNTTNEDIAKNAEICTLKEKEICDCIRLADIQKITGYAVSLS